MAATRSTAIEPGDTVRVVVSYPPGTATGTVKHLYTDTALGEMAHVTIHGGGYAIRNVNQLTAVTS